MNTVIVLLAAGTMLVLGLFMAYVLGWANRAFHVAIDPRQEQIQEALPGANCGGCGYVGCNEYAEAVVSGQVSVDKCTVGGVSCAAALAKILGVEMSESWPKRPVVHCGATYEDRLGRLEYRGEQTCGGANLIAGVQGCTYGCLGFGDCQWACEFDAIGIVNGLATVDYDACVGCGACARACPRNIITMVPFKAEKMLVVACSNKDFGKDVKGVCKVGCIGCKRCQKLSEGLIQVEENRPRFDYDAYDPDSLEAVRQAVEKCPMKRLVEAGRPSEKDLAAVADETVPAIIEADFKTTVDKTDYRG